MISCTLPHRFPLTPSLTPNFFSSLSIPSLTLCLWQPPNFSAIIFWARLLEVMTTKEEKGTCNQSRRSCSSHPAWLLSTLAEMDERMKMLALNGNTKTKVEGGDATDTFAQRAESYYQKRPQLLALLQDLYNAYLTLADRYSQTQTLAKQYHHHHRRQSSNLSQIQALHLDGQGDTNSYDEEDDDIGAVSDVESSLSYQPQPPPMHAKLDVEAMIAEIVMKNVECDILLHEVSTVERRFGESTRKIELQKSLLEVLESERMILLNENVRLGYKVSALIEENKGLASESLFMKRKAGELARCVLKMREDHRVCMLSRKIEDLQGQIYGLEKRNKEYYGQLMKRDQEVEQLFKSKNKKKKLGLEVCFQVHKLKMVENADVNVKGKDGGKVFKWWERVKNLDLFICGPSPGSI
ncbi:kinase-interacting family protein-like isoform X1 [Vitis riparia]|uniref:kinase-interacting family protein-like isoform X1 n=2 Tax=Vitis riparia TaxID=96939 RepID=UPI00155AB653|nr:kinase-interacting family protein-like isoform X1 [Vitis riparia]